MTVTPGPWPGSPAPPEPLPVAIEAEQGVLGALLLFNSAHSVVADFLRAEHFGEPVHQRIFAEIEMAVASGAAFSPITIRSALKDVELAPGVTLGAYLSRLATEATNPRNVRAYGQAVWSSWARRQIIGVCQDADRLARDLPAGMSVRDLAADAVAGLEEAARGHEPPERSTIGRAAEKALRAMDEARRAGGKLLGTTFGLPAMDRRTQGMQRGELIILAGRPGMGKTTVALGMAVRAAQAGHGVAVFSLEMGDEALARRALADLSFRKSSPPIRYFDIRSGRITPEQDEVLTRAAMELDGLPIVIEQSADMTTSQLLGRCRTISAEFTKQGRSLDLVVVDHLGLLSTGRRVRSRVEEVSEISRALKILAKQVSAPVLALSQLNRAAEARTDRRPMLSDLRDSGSIEQDADVVIGCYREAYYLKDSEKPEDQALLEHMRTQLELIVLKQRDGACFTHNLFCDVECNHIADLHGA